MTMASSVTGAEANRGILPRWEKALQNKAGTIHDRDGAGHNLK
jgi:hypothetical protein